MNFEKREYQLEQFYVRLSAGAIKENCMQTNFNLTDLSFQLMILKSDFGCWYSKLQIRLYVAEY